MSNKAKPTITENDLESIATARRKIKSTPPKIAVNIVGPPGIGKSTMVKELADELGISLLDVRAQQIESIDLRGMPAVVDLEEWLAEQKSMGVDTSKIDTSKLPPTLATWRPFINLLPIPAIHGEKGILFLDEFNLASIDVKKACYQLILDRKVGGYVLPEGWRIIMAGNRREDVGDDFVSSLGNALSNRLRHIHVSEPKTEEQRQDMYRWFYEHNVHPSIIAFLKFSPDAIFDMPKPTEQEEVLAYPTPRSWHMFSEQIMYSDGGLLDENGNLTKDKLLLFSECADYVGKGWAMQYANFVSVFNDIPDPKTILEKGVQTALKKSNIPMPTAKEPGKLHALITSVVSYFKEMYKQPDVVKNFFDFVKEIKVPEFEMLAVKEAWGIKDLKETLKATPEFVQFCKKHCYMMV